MDKHDYLAQMSYRRVEQSQPTSILLCNSKYHVSDIRSGPQGPHFRRERTPEKMVH